MKRQLVLIGIVSTAFAGVLLAARLIAFSGDENGSVRSVAELNSGWHFVAGNPTNALTGDVSKWDAVLIPHCWNVRDGAGDDDVSGKTDYRRGPAWYALTFPTPVKSQDRRFFLKFNGASIVSDVYLNGTHLGQHRGAFGAFCFEITTNLFPQGTNDLRVCVDNSLVADVPPLSGDFTMFGGIYRPVQLISTADVCISPLDYASPGVALVEKSVSATEANVDVTASLARPARDHSESDVRVTLADASGNTVQTAAGHVKWSGESGRAKISLHINSPHLWNGVLDPYLYGVRVEVLVAGKVVDDVTQKLGLRFVTLNAKQGFLLNGKPVRLNGVALHQDRKGKGWAVSKTDEFEDMAIIREIGANALRLAHYQHSDSFLDLCDRNGLLVWAENPLINEVCDTPEFQAVASQQLTELIKQQRNHSSIIMWGLFNELYHQGNTNVACEGIVNALQALAKREDPTRLTTAASNQPKRKELNRITDLLALNVYPGWYGTSTPDSMKWFVKDWAESTGRSRLGISEYGAGASPNQHVEWPPAKPDIYSRFHPEEYQVFCHEGQYKALCQNPSVWGSFAWNLFDFASDTRTEGESLGINDKGLVTYDRKIRKDAFFFYKANWNPAPMVNICSRRYTPRHARITTVRAYSNCDVVELVVNGRSKGKAAPDNFKIAVWNKVNLNAGHNQIELHGWRGETQVNDSCEWEVDDTAPAASTATNTIIK